MLVIQRKSLESWILDRNEKFKTKLQFVGATHSLVYIGNFIKGKAIKRTGDRCLLHVSGRPWFWYAANYQKCLYWGAHQWETRYITSSGLTELKEEIVKKLGNNGISSAIENVVVTTGAKFAIFSAICALCGPDDEVIIIAPYWLSYLQMIKASGAKAIVVKTVPANN